MTICILEFGKSLFRSTRMYVMIFSAIHKSHPTIRDSLANHTFERLHVVWRERISSLSLFWPTIGESPWRPFLERLNSSSWLPDEPWEQASYRFDCGTIWGKCIWEAIHGRTSWVYICTCRRFWLLSRMKFDSSESDTLLSIRVH